MKKYILTSTGEEVEYGETIQLSLESVFHPSLIPLLLENGIIEEREVEVEGKASAKGNDIDGKIEGILETQEDFDLSLEALKALVANLTREVDRLNGIVFVKQKGQAKKKVV